MIGRHNYRVTAILIAVLLILNTEITVFASATGSAPTSYIVQEGEDETDNSQPDDTDKENPEADPENDLEENPEKEPAEAPEKEPEEDSKGNPEKEPAEAPEKEPEEDPKGNPEEDSEKEPEENPEEDSEKEPEENPEESIVSDEELEESGDIEGEDLTELALSEDDALLSVAVLSAPENLKLDNTHPYIKTLQWDTVEGAAGYEIYYAVDSGYAGKNLNTNEYKLLASTTENIYECNLAENTELNPTDEFNRYPVETQYYSYRVKAVCPGDEEDITSSFSEPVCSNGMYADSLPYINKKRTEYHLPGTGDYIRFYLGNAEGTEYNEANPIQLHQGEGIDELTLWAVCEDGSRVSYSAIRDAIDAYEKAHEKITGMYREESDAARYGFTWCISDGLSSAEYALYANTDYISSYVKYAGNTVSDKLGFKAEQITSERMYLAVALNNSLAPGYGSLLDEKYAMCFEFFVPVIIKEAEAGSVYDDFDQSDAICSSGEELWQKARQKIHDREKEFVLLLDENTYNAFLDKYEYRSYTEWNGDVFEDYVSLVDEKITDTWLFTRYAEQDWMEPWAGDNLQDCISKCNYGSVEIVLNGTWYYGIKWSAEYFTTAEQEKELDAKIAELLGEGGVLHDACISDNPLKKIQAAYDYTRGITWVDGTKNPLNYTVYSGVILRKGSCESSSLTFVRLCREMGIQARVVKDNYWGGAGNHAWNIVEYKGQWYYVDCTGNDKFLKGSSAYNPSQQLPIYSEKEFTDNHPLSKSDYALKKVTYYLNGGVNASVNPSSYEPGDVLTFTMPEKIGYTFEGWYADKTFRTQITGPEGGSCDTSSLAGSLTLYAKWKANEYTLSYNINKPEDAEIKVESLTTATIVKYDSSVKIAANKNTMYKYKFTGWNTMADGSGTTYKAGASVKNLTTGGECILYAQWVPTTYTVKYDSNASSLGLSAKGKVANKIMTFYSAENTTSANAFKIDGYKFIGWNTRADGKGLSLAGQEETDGTVSGFAVIGTALESIYAKDTGATVVLYAQWEAIPYTVNLYKNDGATEDEPALSLSMDIGKTLSSRSEISKITRDGYTLVSWNTMANGKGKKYALNAKNLTKPSEEIILYAQWSKPISYKITYNLDGGKNATKNPKNYTVASTEAQRTLLNPTKTGYTFVKWVDAAEKDPETAPKIETIPEGTCRNITLRAVWSENSYQVTYHGADEKYTDVTASVTKIYKYTELADTFAPAKEFTLKASVENKVSISAWTTKPNGKGKIYTVGKSFSKLSADNFDESGKGSIDLYAKWSTAVYKITYQNCESRDGVKNSNPASYVYNAKKAVSLKAPSRTGYIFAGWTAEKDYFDQTKNQIKAGTAEDVVLTADWIPITYAVKLNLNVKDKGVSFKENAQTVYGDTKGTGIEYNIEESSFTTHDVVNIPAYYELIGWNTKSNGKGIAAKCTEDNNSAVASVHLAGLGTKNKGTVTLYAVWKPKTYTIIYKNIDPDNSSSEEIAELTDVKVTNPAEYTYSASKAVKLKNPTKYGFVFEGWYREYNPATGEFSDKISSIPKGSYGDIILYGKWRIK